MAPMNVSRTCPFCGTKLFLNNCAIVCTSAPDRATFDGSPDQGAAPAITPSGAQAKGKIGNYLILREAKTPGQTGLWAKAFGQLKPLMDEFHQADLPRRVCGQCRTPLPLEMDEYDAYVLAVVGLNRAGKSFFIGAAFNAASRNDALCSFGVESFEALDDTPTRLHQDYFQGLFRNNYTLDATPVSDHVEKSPLVFLVRMSGSKPFVLVSHDVSGEALMDRRARATTAGFVSRANAVIFLADPLDMFQIVSSIPKEADVVGVRSLDQPSLLEATLRELRPVNGKQPPLALTISKSDLMAAATGKSYTFDSHRPGRDWRREIKDTGDEVRATLVEINEHRLIRLAEQHSPSSFHAISVLGSPERRIQAGGRPQPVRVLDPLGTVLEQLRLGQVNAN